MSTAAPIQTPMTWRASSPTSARATFAAARTNRRFWEKSGRALPAVGSRPLSRRDRGSRLPGVGDLVEHLGAEALGRAGDRAAAERAIEFHRPLVVGERPYNQALQAALDQILARGGKQAAAEAEALVFRTQVQLVDLAVIEQAARAVAPVIGVAGDAVTELQDGDAAALADGAVPPIRPAPVDQLVELVARDDALIGRAPCLVMCLGDVHRIGCLGAAHLYEGRAHFGIEATNPAPFKPYPINADEVLATHSDAPRKKASSTRRKGRETANGFQVDQLVFDSCAIGRDSAR